MALKLKHKIVLIVIAASLLPLLIMALLTYYQKERIGQTVIDQTRELSRNHLRDMALNVYDMCRIANDLITKQLTDNSAVFNAALKAAGGLNVSATEFVEWKAKNQVTGEEQTVRLPKMRVGDTWLGQNYSFATPTYLIDETAALLGETCTILQRMNERGDMLRVASNVKAADGTRAAGTYIPAVDQKGNPTPVVAAILSGAKYTGRAQVLSATYLATYEPVKDAAGQVIGCHFVGVRLDAMESIEKVIRSVKIGKSGYVGVLYGSGEEKGTYVISPGGSLDRKNILNEKDSQGNPFVKEMIDDAIKKKGEIGFKEYLWVKPDDKSIMKKTSAFIYFEPWDWVIFPGLYEVDFIATQQRVTSCLDKLLHLTLLVGLATLVLTIFFALYLGSKIANPIIRITEIARKIAAGNLHDASTDLISIRGAAHDTGDAASARDETSRLIESFTTMTTNLNALVGQVQKSTIQLVSTTTEIAAASKEQEATVNQFSGSTNEIVASSKEIAATAKQLLGTIGEVKEVAGSTADHADAGQNGLIDMQSTMKHLATATESVSGKLSIINEKANNINDVVTTITKVADQTNLLSLNAAIEAEKAGEYGLGFSVVAREIRRLADQTAVATLDIIKMVKEMQSAVSSGVMEMDKFSDQVRRCVTDVGGISGKLESIIQQVQCLPTKFDLVAEGMQGQAEGAQQITEAMVQLNEAARQTSESLREFNQATVQLNDATKAMQVNVSIFKVI